MHNQAKILFLGTPLIAAEVLKFLIEEGFNVIGAISQVDKLYDKKGNLLPTEVKQVCNCFNIPVYQYEKIKEHIEEIKDLKPDVILTIAYGQILPLALLEIPSIGAINLHGSILPKLRGAAPIQHALLQGFKETGFTLQEMAQKMDAGKMYAKEYVEISDDDNYTSLYKKMIECAKRVVQNHLDNYLNNKLTPELQNEEEVTFANKILPADEILSLKDDANTFINKVRGLSYEPGGYLYLNDKKLKILKAKYYSSDITHQIGEILFAKKDKLILQLKDGQINILELQLQGKKIMRNLDFNNGNNLLGKKLSNEL